MADVVYETAGDELAALMNGSLVLKSTDEGLEVQDEEVTDDEETDSGTEVDEINVDDEAETNEVNDEDPNDTDEVDEDDDTDDLDGKAPVDEASSDDDSDEGTPADDVDGESKDVVTDGTEPEPTNDGEEVDTEVIDYKKQYEELLEGNTKLQGFYDEVTSEFTANGRKVKGFTDPKKIIQSQQMSIAFGDKMAAFKPYRGFMSAIKEQGWLENPEKFDMAVNLMNKDPEAIKSLIKESGIDPLELDLENISYNGAKHVASSSEVVLDDMLASARSNGIEEDVQKVLGGSWLEDGSLATLLESQDEAQGLINQMVKNPDTGTSIYDEVQARISEKSRTDSNGVFAGKSTLAKYKIAAGELESEYLAAQKQAKLESIKETQRVSQQKVAEAKAKILAEKEAKAYTAKLAADKVKTDAARVKAASLSTPKKKAKAIPKFDPVDKSQSLEGDELMDYFNKQILGKS